jgi:hypothetical protein
VLTGVVARSSSAAIFVTLIFFVVTGCVHRAWTWKEFLRERAAETGPTAEGEEAPASSDRRLRGAVRGLELALDALHCTYVAAGARTRARLRQLVSERRRRAQRRLHPRALALPLHRHRRSDDARAARSEPRHGTPPLRPGFHRDALRRRDRRARGRRRSSSSASTSSRSDGGAGERVRRGGRRDRVVLRREPGP